MSCECGWNRRRRTRGSGISASRIAGLVLMLAGGLMLLIFVPRWVWMGALSIVMMSVGFLLWRFSE